MADYLPLKGIDFVEWYVGNARQTAHFFKSVFGFTSLAYAGPETGLKDRVSYVIEQGSIRLVLTTPLHAGSEIATHVHMYGDGVKCIALEVSDARQAFMIAVQHGAQPYMLPKRQQDPKGEVVISGIHAYGDNVHMFVERQQYEGIFLPGFEPWESDFKPASTGLYCIDHISGHVSKRDIRHWRNFYRKTMGFTSEMVNLDDRFSHQRTTLLYRSLGDTTLLRFPIHEAGTEAVSRAFNSIYMEWAKIPGVNHVALRTNNIQATIETLKARGLDFWPVERLDFTAVVDKLSIDFPEVARLRRCAIMPTKDTWGYMLRAFTRPLEDRQRVCIEIVQRLDELDQAYLHRLFEELEQFEWR